MTLQVRISSCKTEGILQVSRWLKVQVLADPGEMEALFTMFPPDLFLASVSEPATACDAMIPSKAFLVRYAEYVDLLKQGKVPATENFRRHFSCAISQTSETFYAIAAGNDRYLIRPSHPVIQLQAHHFFYSSLDKKFHPMVLSADSVTWGLQFSYPQLFQDPKTRQIRKVMDTPEFPNSALFSTFLKWMRNTTLPTPFEVDGTRVNAPIRTGKKTLSWIQRHPQLHRKGIRIFIPGAP